MLCAYEFSNLGAGFGDRAISLGHIGIGIAAPRNAVAADRGA